MSQYLDINSIPLEILKSSVSNYIRDSSDTVYPAARFLLNKYFKYLGDNYHNRISPTDKSENNRDNTQIMLVTDKKVIIDIIGKPKVDKNTVFGASFLAGKNPKAYLLTYVWLYKNVISQFSPETCPSIVIWVDDYISRVKYSRTIDEQAIITSKYVKFFGKFDVKIITSSNFFQNEWVIPEAFIASLSSFSFEHFFDLLPYHRRDVNVISIFDFIHFLWSSFVLSIFPSNVLLTSINTKRQMQVLKNYFLTFKSIIFLPQVPLDKGQRSTIEIQNKEAGSVLPEKSKVFIRNYYLWTHPNSTEEMFEKELKLILTDG